MSQLDQVSAAASELGFENAEALIIAAQNDRELNHPQEEGKEEKLTVLYQKYLEAFRGSLPQGELRNMLPGWFWAFVATLRSSKGVAQTWGHVPPGHRRLPIVGELQESSAS